MRVTRINNGFTAPDTTYAGLNVTWRTAAGSDFEIQFHTAQSLNTRNTSHKTYRKWQDLEVNIALAQHPAERQALQQANARLLSERKAQAAAVALPEGIQGIPSIRYDSSADAPSRHPGAPRSPFGRCRTPSRTRAAPLSCMVPACLLLGPVRRPVAKSGIRSQPPWGRTGKRCAGNWRARASRWNRPCSPRAWTSSCRRSSTAWNVRRPGICRTWQATPACGSTGHGANPSTGASSTLAPGSARSRPGSAWTRCMTRCASSTSAAGYANPKSSGISASARPKAG